MSLVTATSGFPSATTTLGASVAIITPRLTTTFTPTAAICTGNHLTMLANREFEIWMNMPVPVPGTTMTDCYPDQFMQSFLSAAGGITQPAFDPLVCPQSYSAVGPYTSNYIACCPSGYSFAQPKTTPFSDRPAYGGTCYTNIEMATPVLVTAYGSSGITATTTYSATNTLAQAYAYPYEGKAFGVAQVASITPAPSAGSPTSILSDASTANMASGTSGKTFTVIAAAGPTFIPSVMNAKVGDQIVFEFSSGNHSLTQSTFNSPCSPLINGFDSGYMGSNAGESKIMVNVSTAQFFFSKQSSDCSEGMVFSLNPTNAEPAAAFQAKAIAQPSPLVSSGMSAAVKAGIALGCICGFGILLLIALFFLRKRRQVMADSENAKDGSESSESFHAPSPTTLGSAHTRNYPNNLSPIDTMTSPIGPSLRPFPPAPRPPPKGEELHGISSPLEMAAYNQAAVELQGSEGGKYASNSEKGDNYQQAEGVLESYHRNTIQEMLSPQNGLDQNDYSRRTWNEKSLGSFSSRTTESTAYTLDTALSPRHEGGEYDRRKS